LGERSFGDAVATLGTCQVHLAEAVHDGLDEPLRIGDGSFPLALVDVCDNGSCREGTDAQDGGSAQEVDPFGWLDGLCEGLLPGVDKAFDEGREENLVALADQEAFEGSEALVHSWDLRSARASSRT
jgi:hypothetical protein